MVRKTLALAALLLPNLGLAVSDDFMASTNDGWDQDTLRYALTGGDSVTVGGYGAPVVKQTRVANRSSVIMGGRGAAVLNHSLTIGGGGYGLTSDVTVPGSAQQQRLDFTYGGPMVGYTIMSDQLFHAHGNVLAAVGQVDVEEQAGAIEGDFDEDDNVLVLEPEIQAELNVTSYCRLAVGMGYRFVSGLQIAGLNNEDLSGFTGTVLVKFGSF